MLITMGDRKAIDVIDWDIESYKNGFEPAEHWQLKKEFMLAHKDRIKESRLVCLAQTFVNHEILGCQYPSDVMKELSVLSRGLATKYHNSRKNSLKRTFVGASDAAKAKVCRTSFKSECRKEVIPKSNLVLLIEKSMNSKSLLAKLILLFDVQIYINQNVKAICIIRDSAQRSKMKYIVESFVDGFHIAKLQNMVIQKVKVTPENSKLNKKELEEHVSKLVLKSLCKSCVLLKMKRRKHGDHADIEDLRKNCQFIEAEGITEVNIFGNKIDENNIGSKMMRKMGFGQKGGQGLGKNESGKAEPIIVNHCVNRRGLGYNPEDGNKEFKNNITQIVSEYAVTVRSSEQKWDLVFSPNFTKDQRDVIHNSLDSYKYLKHQSYGKGEKRYLVISLKMSLHEEILNKLMTGDETDEYHVIEPGKYDLTTFGL